MTIFKTYLKIVNANKGLLILYTVLLLFIGTLNMQTSDNNMNFETSKPNILIINNDNNENKITNSFVKYITDNSTIVELENNEDTISDALFYREISYIIYIQENFGENYLNNKNPQIEVRSTENTNSSIAEMLVNKYLSTSNIYLKIYNNENDIIEKTEETLNKETSIEINSKLDTVELSNARYFYNFMNYSIIAGCVFVICIVLASFKNEKIKKRTEISSLDYKKLNTQLLISNGLFAITLWLAYTIISIFVVGDIMLTKHGILFMINSLFFTISSLTLAILIANITCNKNAINGIVNVLALGSSFLCGSFVPMEILPDSVLKVGHIFPSFYFIKNNEIIKTLEVINIDTLKHVLLNISIMILFSIGFIIITNIISNHKRKIN